ICMQPAIRLDTATERAVCCSQFTSPTDFWLQLKDDDSRSLQKLTSELTSLHSEGLLKPIAKVKTSDFVAVINSENVYRGQVLASESSDYYRILLVDSGETINVPIQSLFLLPEEFKALNKQAVHCKLRLIKEPDGGWKPDECQRLWTEMSSQGTDVLQAVFVPDDSESVESLVPVELCSRTTCKSINVRFGIATKSLDLESNMTQMTTSAGVNYLGVVTHISSSGLIFVQKVSDAKRLHQLESQLEILANVRFSSHSDVPSVFGVEVGGKYYRASLLGRSDDALQVNLLDYGSNATIKVTDCFVIPSQLQYAPLAKAFLIDKRVNNPLNEKHLAEVRNFIGFPAIVSVTPVEDSNSLGNYAEIIPCHSGLRLSDWLETRNIFKAADTANGNPNSRATSQLSQNEIKCVLDDVQSLENSEGLSFVPYDYTSLNAGCSYSAVCCATEGTGAAYFQLDKDKSILEMVSSVLNSNSLNELSLLSTFKIGAPVIFKQNNCLCRGLIRSVSYDTNTCLIFSVDFGTLDTVSMSSIFAASNKICNIPVCCVKVDINDFRLLKSSLSSVLSGACCIIKINSVSADVISASVALSADLNGLTIDPNGVEISVERANSTSALSGSFCSYDTRLTPLSIAYIAKSPPNDSFLANITHIENLCSFYLLLDEDVELLRTTMSKIQEIAKSSCKLEGELHAGQPCLAMYTENFTWYRAALIANLDNAHYVVKFVDYGNIALVPQDFLRCISDEALKCSAFALHCSLADCDLRFYREEAITSFRKLLNKQLSVKVVDKDSIPIKVRLQFEKHDFLTSLHKLPTTAYQQAYSKHDANELYADHVKSSKSKHLLNCMELNWIVSKKSYISSSESVVSHASPLKDYRKLHLWIQSSRDLDELASLQSQLDVEAASSEALTAPQIGQFCIGLFEGGWYRAEVKAVSSDSIRVLFIDYGNEEEGSLDELQLKVLPKREELYRDAFAFECILQSSDNCCFSTDACDKIVEYGELQFSIDPSTDSEPPTVSIPKDILQSLTVIEVTDAAAANADSAAVIESGKQQIESQANKSETWAVSKSTQSGTFTGVVSLVTPSDDGTKLHLWIQSSRDLDELASLQSQLDVEAASSEALTAPQIGQFCIGLFEGGWYRAEVKAVSSDSIRVLFIDYGNEEEGSLDELQLKVLPQREELYRDVFAFECILQSSDNCCFSTDACDKIVEYGELQFSIDPSTDSEPPTVSIPKDILQSLTVIEVTDAAAANADSAAVIESGKQQIESQANKSETWAVSKSTQSGTFTGVVSLVTPSDDGTKLHLWIQSSRDLDELASLQSQLDVEAASSEALTAPQIGQFCIGLFEGGWYRAEVKAVSSDSIRVLFIDYGNEEEGSLDELQLKVLPQREELYRDVFAFECILQSSDNCCFSTDACDKIVEYGELQFSIDPSTDSEPPTVSIPKDILQSLTVIEVTDAAAANADSAAVIESGKQQIESQANKSETWAVSKSTQSGTFTGVVSLVTPSDDGTKLHLWIQSSRDLDELASLQSQLDVEAASSEALTAPQIGQFCIGLFEGGWYRAEVKAVSSDSIRVLFIDYGNEEEGSLDELQLKVLPQREELYRDVFAFECILQSSDNCCFSTDACDKIVEYGELQFSIDPSTDSEPPTVSIPKDILQSLTVIEVTDAAAANADSAAVIESGKQQIESQANKSETWAVSKSTQSGTFTGVVSLVTPSDDGTKLHLWIQSSRDLDELASLQSQLDVEAASSEALTAPQIGQFCIGLFEGGWYRAEVKAVSSDSIRVLFIDYGNEEEGSLDELQLKVLPQREELYRDAFAFECILKSSDNRCFSPDACDKIVEYGELQFSIDPSTDSEPPTVSIPKDILQSLTVIEVTDAAAANADSAAVIESGKQQIESQANKSETWAVSKSTQSGTFTGVVSLVTPSDDGTKLHLWIQSSRDLDELASLQSQLDVEAASSEALTAPQIGQFCIGLFEGGWYRAEVKAVSSDSIRVLFIDYGNEEEGSLDELQLKVLPKREELYRDAFAFECILESSDNRCFSPDACDKIVEYGELQFSIDPSTDSKPPTVSIPKNILQSLTVTEVTDSAASNANNTVVIELGKQQIESQANKSETWAVSKSIQSGTFTGVVSNATLLDDGTKLHLWIQNTRDLDELASLQSQLDVEAASSEALTAPQIGQFCIGLFEGGWYRAEVKAVSSDSIRVLFIDYGNEEEGSLDELQLKVLPQREELYRDAFAFECILQSSDNCCFTTDACDKIVEYGELQFSIDPSTDSEPPTVSIPKDILQSLTVTEVTNSAASLASINNNKLKPAVLPASTSIFFDGENNENFHKSWCKVPLTPMSYESGSDRPENSEVLATVCCLQPITNCSKQSNTCNSEAEKRQHQQYRPRLRYTPDQLRAVFASMVHDYGCTIVPTPVPLPGRYSVIILPSSNSSQLMVHLLPQSLQQVDRLAKRMHFWYNKLGLLIKPVTKLYPGKSVAFFTMKSHGGGEWYRGRVLSIDTRNSQEVSATVLAVDYGFVSSGLLTSFIRELPPDLTGPEWPAAICICRLASKDVLPQQPSLKRAGIEVLSDGTCCLLPPSKNADRNVEK
ncbi:hypothetical protein BOX15_Mlig002131g2, partial [Macrostomum lignano]